MLMFGRVPGDRVYRPRVQNGIVAQEHEQRNVDVGLHRQIHRRHKRVVFLQLPVFWQGLSGRPCARGLNATYDGEKKNLKTS